MALVLADRVRETTTTVGTGTVTLAGAVTGYQSFAIVGNGNTTYYTIAGQGTSEWEVGIGTYTSSGTTLARTTVLESSNSGSLVSFSAGTKDVFVTYPADKSVNQDANGNVGIGTSSPDANLTVNGAASFAAGSAAAPSIARAGDLNTGIFFPAADTIAFSEGGVEAMRITSTGAIAFNGASNYGTSGQVLTSAGNAPPTWTTSGYTLKGITYLTSGTAATYTTPANVRAIYVECVGGGGGGGGVDGQGSGTGGGAGGGAGGGYVAKLITSPSATYTYTIGAGGTGGAAGANGGTVGGDTTFTDGTITLTATSGNGGGGITASASNAYYNQATGGDGIGGDVGIGGQRGGARSRGTFVQYYGGYGGGSFFGQGGGGNAGTNASGGNGTNYGCGGGGGANDATTSNYAGGNGYQGVIRITEYY